MRIMTIILGAVTALANTPAAGDSLRCGQQLVQVGDAITSVLEDCGKPKRRARLVNDDGDRIGTVLYLDAGYGKSLRRVEFHAGRVNSIERID